MTDRVEANRISKIALDAATNERGEVDAPNLAAAIGLLMDYCAETRPPEKQREFFDAINAMLEDSRWRVVSTS